MDNFLKRDACGEAEVVDEGKCHHRVRIKTLKPARTLRAMQTYSGTWSKDIHANRLDARRILLMFNRTCIELFCRHRVRLNRKHHS
jgi:hypothetical protein